MVEAPRHHVAKAKLEVAFRRFVGAETGLQNLLETPQVTTSVPPGS